MPFRHSPLTPHSLSAALILQPSSQPHLQQTQTKAVAKQACRIQSCQWLLTTDGQWRHPRVSSTPKARTHRSYTTRPLQKQNTYAHPQRVTFFTHTLYNSNTPKRQNTSGPPAAAKLHQMLASQQHCLNLPPKTCLSATSSQQLLALTSWVCAAATALPSSFKCRRCHWCLLLLLRWHHQAMPASDSLHSQARLVLWQRQARQRHSSFKGWGWHWRLLLRWHHQALLACHHQLC
jgi:hypothetical protein